MSGVSIAHMNGSLNATSPPTPSDPRKIAASGRAASPRLSLRIEGQAPAGKEVVSFHNRPMRPFHTNSSPILQDIAPFGDYSETIVACCGDELEYVNERCSSARQSRTHLVDGDGRGRHH
jgi:hypothetical protein